MFPEVVLPEVDALLVGCDAAFGVVDGRFLVLVQHDLLVRARLLLLFGDEIQAHVLLVVQVLFLVEVEVDCRVEPHRMAIDMRGHFLNPVQGSTIGWMGLIVAVS